ncbi:MAG: ISAs1 family transposase [Clostridiales bacterium]|jgi:predicted transposase YbfD/YdcC|nr:ISAs1 family transposase [Clostridiales bacterium]
MDIKGLTERIGGIRDPRRTKYGNLRHKLVDIIVIGLCTIVCGGEDFVDMEEFGPERESWLRNFLELPSGIPDSDTIRRVFERLNPAEVSKCLTNWVETEREKGKTVNIDGKTICGSGNAAHKAYHVVSARVSDYGITLGDIAVDEKTNEITAIPELLELIDVSGDVVTIDAMGCQKGIAKKITEKGGDYVLGLKGNQGALPEEVEYYFRNETWLDSKVVREKGHGRIEKREYALETKIDWLYAKKEWSNLNGIGIVRSKVIEKGVERNETRYFITSLKELEQFSNSVRGHWAIENRLHWTPDVVFGEDAARAKKDQSPLNMNILRKTALALLKNAALGNRLSIRKKMLKAALNPNVLSKTLFQK